MRFVCNQCCGRGALTAMRPHSLAINLVNKIGRLALPVALALFAVSCGTANQEAETSTFIPPPPDLKELRGVQGSCVSEPRSSTVTAAERCWIRVLSERCSLGDDCLTTCIASGKGALIGGGCWHVCSQPPNSLANWKEPAAAHECKSLGTVHGYSNEHSDITP